MTTATNLPREAQAFLDALAVGESAGDYTVLYGGVHYGDAMPSLPDHFGFPDWAGKDNSHAAGRYQFEPATWLDVCTRLFPAGTTPNFRNPADQDWGAWLLAKDVYHKAIGADLGIMLHAGTLGGIANTLHLTWTSLSEDTFPDRYKAALAALPAAPVAPAPAPAPTPVP